MTGNDDYTAIVEWLHELAPDTRLVWGDMHATTLDAHSGWVDVSVEGCDLSYNWLWTVDAPDQDDDTVDYTNPTTVVCDHDVSIWAIWDTDTMWYLDEPVSVVAVGETPNEATMRRLDAAVAEHPDRRTLNDRGGWSLAALNAALNKWCATHADRGDITFEYSASVGANDKRLEAAQNVLDAIDSGAMQTYEIGDGVLASDVAFDQILALDADTQAALTAHISEIANSLRFAAPDDNRNPAD